MIKVFMIIALVTFPSIVESQAADARPKLKCSTYLDTADAFTPNGKVRADEIFFCANDDRAILHYRASAMIKRSFPGRQFAPWLSLRIVDDQDKILYKNPSFHVAEVVPCAGNQGHVAAVPRKFDFKKAYKLEVELTGNVGGKYVEGCGRPPDWVGSVKYDLENLKNRILEGKMKPAEKALLAYFLL